MKERAAMAPSRGTVRTRRTGARGLIVTAFAGLAASASIGCDPCFGTVGCSTAELVSVNGQIVQAEDGRGTAGVRVDVIRTGGVQLTSDSASAVTDGDGHWRIELPALSQGDVLADIVVTAPPSSYRVTGVALRTHTRSGEANVMGRWTAHPHFPISAQLNWRGTDGEPVANAAVEVRRTGGVEMFGDGFPGGVGHSATDGSGRAPLFGYFSKVFAESLGIAVADITVTTPSGERVTTSNVRLLARHTYHPPLDVIVFGVGPSLHWVIVMRDRVTHQDQPGVVARFTRTGGIPVTPPTFTATSDAGGRIAVPLRALAEGTVIGDLELTPPAPGEPFTIHGFELTTYDEDIGRFLGVIGVMPYMPYFGVVKIGEQGASDVMIEFRRTGGIPLRDDVVTSRSFMGGFVMYPVPLAQGEVIGDLTIHAPAPYPSFVVRNLRMTTVDGEGRIPDRLLYVWGLDLVPSGPPGTTVEILDR